MSIIKTFFNPSNIVGDVDDGKYKMLGGITKMADAIVRTSGCGIYILDYFKQDVAFVSDNIAKWCGILHNEVEQGGYDVFFKYISEEDFRLLTDVNNAAFDFWKGKNEDECMSYEISYDFRYGGFMVNQHYTPVAMQDGKIWLAMCEVSLSSQKSRGNIMMKSCNEGCCYVFSVESKQWSKVEMISLTEREKAIIRYSVQGLSSKEIGEILLVGAETIRKQKTALFRKLGVHSINEATQFAINNCLL